MFSVTFFVLECGLKKKKIIHNYEKSEIEKKKKVCCGFSAFGH